MVKGNMAVIKNTGDGDFDDIEMNPNLHFVNKKIKYVWDSNIQVSCSSHSSENRFVVELTKPDLV